MRCLSRPPCRRHNTFIHHNFMRYSGCQSVGDHWHCRCTPCFRRGFLNKSLHVKQSRVSQCSLSIKHRNMVCVSTTLNTLACFFLFLASIAESEDGEAEGVYDPTKTVYPGKKEKKSNEFFQHLLSFIFLMLSKHQM